MLPIQGKFYLISKTSYFLGFIYSGYEKTEKRTYFTPEYKIPLVYWTYLILSETFSMNGAIVDFNLGVGLGYLLTYRTEKFFFNEKYYQFNMFESSAYIPVRASLSFRLGIVTDLIIEGAFFNTFLDDDRSVTEFEKDSDHFVQVNVVYRRFIR